VSPSEALTSPSASFRSVSVSAVASNMFPIPSPTSFPDTELEELRGVAVAVRSRLWDQVAVVEIFPVEATACPVALCDASRLSEDVTCRTDVLEVDRNSDGVLAREGACDVDGDGDLGTWGGITGGAEIEIMGSRDVLAT